MIYKDENGRAKVLGDNELMHWKYIKKIREGKAFRYFYTPEEIRAYEEAKRSANNLDVPAEIWGHRQGKMKETKKIADEAFENRYKNLRKNAKETWEYAKPQSSSSMRKKNEKEYSRNLDKQMARSKDLKKRSDALNKSKSNTIENGGRLHARMDYYDTLNEKDKEKHRRHIKEEVRLRRAEDRIKKAEKKKEKLKSSATKSMSSIRGESQDKIAKGKSAVEKKKHDAASTLKSKSTVKKNKADSTIKSKTAVKNSNKASAGERLEAKRVAYKTEDTIKEAANALRPGNRKYRIVTENERRKNKIRNRFRNIF